MARPPDHSTLLDALLPVARAAGDAIMRIYATDFAVRGKDDASPVTEADERAEALILPALARLAPDIPAVSEEEAAAGRIPAVGERFWLVDPLDGTKEFINRNGEFTVNIALVEHGRPVLGVVFAPALDRLFAGAAGLGAFVEDKGQALAVHTRRCAEPEVALERLRSILAALAERTGLPVEPGRLVLELRPPGMDKGKALRSFVDGLGARPSAVLFAGDDLGDLAAFDAVDELRGEGVPGVLVCSGSAEVTALAERADVVVDGPSGVVDLLGGLVDGLS